jgi:hypothetical protein
MPFTAFDTLALRAMIAGMSHKALRVYVLLATYADRTGICWPGIAELASKSGLRTESVLEALEELERAGLMAYARRNEKDPVTRKQLVNVYEIRGCLIKADSVSDSAFEHETQTTNEITNDNNQFHKNHLQAPPPLTKPRREGERSQASTMRNAEEKGEGQGQGQQQRKDSPAGTAPQNSKATPPPLPPLPRGFDADAELLDQDDEGAARWMVDQAMTRRDGGEYRATLSMANARRYIVRFGRLKCRAAVTMARRDKETKSLIGRADYLLRTSVSEEAQALQNEIDRMNQDSAANGD